MNGRTVAAAVAGAVILVGGVAAASSAAESDVPDGALAIYVLQNQIRDAGQTGNEAQVSALTTELDPLLNICLAEIESKVSSLKSQIRAFAQGGNYAIVDSLTADLGEVEAPCAPTYARYFRP